jgi:permuted papain-like amidase YaeF/Yiix C92 family enzyme
MKAGSMDMRSRLVAAAALYLAQPVRHYGPAATADSQSLAAVLQRGDVLLTDGNTRLAALVKRVTRSPWSHVALYVGPLEEGSDAPCIVEADIAAGVRSVRLSALKGLHIRVLRPVGLNEADRARLADWVVSRIGGEYDLSHAWALGRKLLRLPARLPPRTIAESATRFICSSLLAHAFALIGVPILPGQMAIPVARTADHRYLTPGDFEHAPAFEAVTPVSHGLTESGRPTAG